METPRLVDTSVVEGLPASERCGLAERVCGGFSVRAGEGVADEGLDLLDVGEGLAEDRVAAEAPVHQPDVLGLVTEQGDEAGVEAGEGRDRLELDDRCLDLNDEAELERRLAVHRAEQLDVLLADALALVLPRRDSALEARRRGQFTIANSGGLAQGVDEPCLRPSALASSLRKPVAHRAPRSPLTTR